MAFVVCLKLVKKKAYLTCKNQLRSSLSNVHFAVGSQRKVLFQVTPRYLKWAYFQTNFRNDFTHPTSCNAYEYTCGLTHTLWYTLARDEAKFALNLSCFQAASNNKKVKTQSLPHFWTWELITRKRARSVCSVASQTAPAATILNKKACP